MTVVHLIGNLRQVIFHVNKMKLAKNSHSNNFGVKTKSLNHLEQMNTDSKRNYTNTTK